MSRITYTEKGSPSIVKHTKGRTYLTEGSTAIANAPFNVRMLWSIGNMLGFTQIKRNAVKSRGFSINPNLTVLKDGSGTPILDENGNVIKVSETYTAFNFFKWVAYSSNKETTKPLWYLNTMNDGKYQKTRLHNKNRSMKLIRLPNQGGA